MQVCLGQSQEKAASQSPRELVLWTWHLISMQEGWPPSVQFLSVFLAEGH